MHFPDNGAKLMVVGQQRGQAKIAKNLSSVFNNLTLLQKRQCVKAMVDGDMTKKQLAAAGWHVGDRLWAKREGTVHNKGGCPHLLSPEDKKKIREHLDQSSSPTSQVLRRTTKRLRREEAIESEDVIVARSLGADFT